MQVNTSASAFEIIEGSDEEDNMIDNSKLDTAYLHTNGTVGGEHINSIPNEGQREREHETFARLKIAPLEVPSPDEVVAYIVLQECLELRKRYVFKEAIAPWEK
ncbi:AMP deaminase putative / myoadenylate deaminase putative [Euphorbia peplus]|nr:AMP deaminase putative / myoadenylate deaminase putative [Euphorbia peplus]